MNNAFGLSIPTIQTWSDNYQIADRDVRGQLRILYGRVVNVKPYHHISQHYDVELLDHRDMLGDSIVLNACKRVANSASFDGVGEYNPLEDGDPVLLLAKEGKLEDAVILGSFYTLGDREEYLVDGKGQTPFTTYPSVMNDIKVASQPSVHPSRMAQPDSWVHIVGAKNRNLGFNDPALRTGLRDKREASPQPASIHLKNKNGDVLQYSTGSQIYYADGEMILLTNADGLTKCSRLTKLAEYYTSLLLLMGGSLDEMELPKPDITETTDKTYPFDINKTDTSIFTKSGSLDEINKTYKGIILQRLEGDAFNSSDLYKRRLEQIESGDLILDPSTGKPTEEPSKDNKQPTTNDEIKRPGKADRLLDISNDFNEWAPNTYHLEEVKNLARMYKKAAQECVNNDSATNAVASAVQSDTGQTIPDNPNIKEIKEGPIPESNYGDRRPNQFKPLLVLHETVASASPAVNLIKTPGSGVSYHAIIRQDGTIIRLVPEDKRACGAGNSAFNGEQTRLSAEFPGSVNDFATHYSLETPADGRGIRPAHSGYTNEQYVSLAYLVAKTGIPTTRWTTHAKVDQSGEREDPRSFDMGRLIKEVNKVKGAKTPETKTEDKRK